MAPVADHPVVGLQRPGPDSLVRLQILGSELCERPGTYGNQAVFRTTNKF